MEIAGWPCLSARGEAGALLAVAVVPNARRSALDGLHDGALRVRLAAPPVDGKANAALIVWLADELGLPRRGVRVRRGEAARHKQIEVDAPAAQVRAWLGRCLGNAGE